jgi:hypothetical protein
LNNLVDGKRVSRNEENKDSSGLDATNYPDDKARPQSANKVVPVNNDKPVEEEDD